MEHNDYQACRGEFCPNKLRETCQRWVLFDKTGSTVSDYSQIHTAKLMQMEPECPAYVEVK